MKFGETLYQRSVPRWAAYNFKYNELKHLIKTRTTAGQAVPLTIPGQSKNRWQELDDDLVKLLQAEYDNIALFIKSKLGEIDRRLAHLGKQIKIAEQAAANGQLDRPILQARKYQRLVKDAEEIGEEIQNLARFASVQKTAFRKILKKYRKWTGSTNLQTRLDVEVFSSEKLRTDYSDYQHQLINLSTILTEELAAPMLTGKTGDSSSDRRNRASTQPLKRSIIAQINDAALRGPLAFDAALSTVPYGEAAGSAVYWIHPDNIDEARALIFKYMRDASAPPPPSRTSSDVSFVSQRRKSSVSLSENELTHITFFDNAQRFVKDLSAARPSRIALSAHWNSEPEAVVTLAGLSPTSSGSTVLSFKSKDLTAALNRASNPSTPSQQVSAIQNYLTEHRDVKPLAEISCVRSRYFGITNTADVANWATLDSSITITPVDTSLIAKPSCQPSAGDAFPYAVLHIRWEFARTPTVVRAFDSSHLVERKHGFTLETMAVHTVHKELPQPAWHDDLAKDIRKVPLVPGKRSRASSRLKPGNSDMSGISSGPSSTDGVANSVFSAAGRQSSVTSDDPVTNGEASEPVTSSVKSNRKKKHARIQAPERVPRQQRYWNEFDDGDSDVNPEEGFAIYVDPDAPMFPGAATMSKAFSAMYDSFSRGTQRATSWLPLNRKHVVFERTPLLRGHSTSEADPDSSGSDTDEFLIQRLPKRRSAQSTASHGSQSRSMYRPHQILTRRQKALERTLFLFYTGLIGISFAFLGMSSILLVTGRRKALVEVDAGVITGVIAALGCAFGAAVLIMLRKQRLSLVHWSLVGCLIAMVVVGGVSLLALMFAATRHSAHRKGSSGRG